MRVEFDEKQKNGPQKKRKKKNMTLHLVMFVLMMVMSAVIALCLTVWFNVSNFEVSGNTAYSAEQIIEASGIKLDDNIFRIGSNAAKLNIEKTLPYIANVKIVRKFPGTVRFEVTAAKEYAYFTANNRNVVLDSNMKVLKDTGKPSSNIIELKGFKIASYVVGEQVVFSDTNQIETMNSLIASLDSYGLNGGNYRVTMLDLSDNFDIKFVINDILIEFGNLNYVDKKMTEIKTILPKMQSSSQKRALVVSGLNDKNDESYSYVIENEQ